jgi:hypothetical protein
MFRIESKSDPNRFLLSRRNQVAGLARPVDRFENFLVPCTELEIGKTLLISPDRQHKHGLSSSNKSETATVGAGPRA